MVQKLRKTCLPLPHTQRSLSLDENLRAKEGGKDKTAKTSLLLSSFTIPWSLALRYQSLAFRPRLCAKNEAPKEEAVSATCFRETAHLPLPCNPFFFTLYSRTAWSKYWQGESWTTWPSWITWTNWIAWTIRPERHTMKYSILKLISLLTKNKFFTNRNTVTPFPYTPLKKMKTKAKMCAKNTLLCIS